MTRDEWIALAERCEKATGPEREIDAAIHDAVYGGSEACGAVIRWGGGVQWIAPYTSSLDAITALIERELPEMRWLCRTNNEGGFGNLYRKATLDLSDFRAWPCYAATPALALCAAFCRACASHVPTK
jgi:hypothetical protein